MTIAIIREEKNFTCAAEANKWQIVAEKETQQCSQYTLC